MNICVAIVDSNTPGNIGTIARAMKNFGVDDLKMVDPPELDPDGEAYGYAGQARNDILPNAEEVSFEELVDQYHTVGCTAITNEDDDSHIRFPYLTPRELADDLASIDTDVCLIFGRERIGLTNDELTAIDQICSIPASAEYPVMNLGQAATIVLYELRNQTLADTQHPADIERADQEAIEGIHDQFSEFLTAIDYSDEKRPKTRRLWRRLLGRAHPTGREIMTLHGVFRQGTQQSRNDRSL